MRYQNIIEFLKKYGDKTTVEIIIREVEENQQKEKEKEEQEDK